MTQYSICSVVVEADNLSRSFQPFLCSSDITVNNIDLTIKHINTSFLLNDYSISAKLPYMNIFKEYLTDGEFHWVYKPLDKTCSIKIDSNYSYAEYYISELLNYMNDKEIAEIIKPYLQILLECKLVQKSFIILHSACVELNGSAYAFTGPSGIGKSSRARKWCELLSANWLSGDRPAIDANKGFAYGVPWDGKESIHRNINYPLSAIFKVKRSKTTHLKEMADVEKLQLLSEQSFIPIWDPMLSARVLNSMKKLIKQVPIYELSCDITDESIIESYNIINHSLYNTKEIS